MSAEAIRDAAANFHQCLERLWPLAGRRHISRATFTRYTTALTPDLQIMDLLDNQPEFTKLVWDYLDRLVTDERIAKGRALLEKYRASFDAAERSYGVDRYVITAIWGVESDFGTQGGDRPVIRSTATLPASAAGKIISATSFSPRWRSLSVATFDRTGSLGLGPAPSVRRSSCRRRSSAMRRLRP